jgi:hypothetical protein
MKKKAEQQGADFVRPHIHSLVQKRANGFQVRCGRFRFAKAAVTNTAMR